MRKLYGRSDICLRDSSLSPEEFEQTLGKSWTSLPEFLNLTVFGLWPKLGGGRGRGCRSGTGWVACRASLFGRRGAGVGDGGLADGIRRCESQDSRRSTALHLDRHRRRDR